MLDFNVVSLVATFSAGLFMFLAPCTLPLVPAFLAALTPQSNFKSQQNQRKTLMARVLLFTVGFTFVFMLLGLLSGYVGASLVHYKTLLSQIGGAIIIVFGLVLLNVFNLPILGKSKNLFSVFKRHSDSKFIAILFGIIFGLGWTPCAGPILASILLLAAQSSTAVHGAILLLIFSLGLAIPFLIMGLLYTQTLQIVSVYAKNVRIISILSGVILIILGATLLFEQTLVMTSWGFALYSFFGYAPLCTYL